MPTANCHTDVTYCIDAVGPVYYPELNDNCKFSIDSTITQLNNSIGVYPYVYIVTDSSGNTTTCTTTYSVVDYDDIVLLYSNTNIYTIEEAVAPEPLFVSGGEFYTSPAGLSISPSTGVINGKSSKVGNYLICYDTKSNCPDTSCIEITISEFNLFVPNGVSNNNDGMNDVWEIKNLNYYPNNSVKIYNRWGSPVFQAAPYLNNWQGQSDASLSIGNELTSGTYYYILELGDNSEPRKGAIKLKID
ncbi:MAG: hypothetical protein COB15_11480 [Flavobacteriales bacterium]|nr:MAG: hypothetical protein COB15_11480 [Flavobacteriales bacterium]